jgi:hypothetical protein
MDEIERAVILPKGAQSLAAYGRNYAFSGPNKVVATYLIPSPPLDMREGCEVALKDFKSRPCTKKELEKLARTDALSVAAQTPAGKKRWYNDYRSLPYIDDGGCSQVSVEYEVAAHHVVTVFCNGRA